MQIINNKEEYEEFRPYKSSKWLEEDYPQSYPVIATKYEGGGGLMGEGLGVYAEYPPVGIDVEIFFEAFRKGYDCCRKYE